jgi:ferredoxin-NADP reductase
MSKLRHLANSGWPGRIDLFYSVKSGCDVIFAAELAEIERKFPNVRVHVTVTSDPSWVGRKGRLSGDWISQCVPDISNRLIHLCGPTAMAAGSQRLLRGLGVPDGQIKTEAFGGRPSQSFGDVGEHEVRFAVSDISVTAPAGRTILDVALAAGLSLDHGCRAGVCGRCRKKLVAGSVTIDSDFVLTAEQKAQGLILTCQARPTEAVTIEC